MVKILFGGAFGFLMLLLINAIAGGFAVSYCFQHWFHKSISFVICMVIGLFGGELAIPALVITWILVLAGVLS